MHTSGLHVKETFQLILKQYHITFRTSAVADLHSLRLHVLRTYIA
jgi:hypothetical protein